MEGEVIIQLQKLLGERKKEETILELASLFVKRTHFCQGDIGVKASFQANG